MTQIQDRISHELLSLLSLFLRAVPEAFALALGKAAGRLVYSFSSRRRVAYADLKAALGPAMEETERWRTVRRHYENSGQMFVEILRFPLLSRRHVEDKIRIQGLEHFLKIAGQTRGGILLTAHFGNWELVQIISGLLGKPIHVLARSQKHARLNEFLNRMRESHGSVAVQRGMGIRSLMKSLKAGELIGLVGDQDAGRDQGVIVRFFGRKTTFPTGPFELSRRMGVPIVPAFIARRKGASHEIFVEAPMEPAPGEEGGVEKDVERFVKILENYIRRYPSEWLWESKRWKYSWTKRILILSDGKPGHVKQSQAVGALFREIKNQYGREGMEYPVSKIEVKFRSPWRRLLFPWFALAFIPWAQGRLRWLGFFFTPETHREILKASADFIISAGSSLAPLNLCLAKDSRAKSIVLMKPSFPFHRWNYDLALIPFHDQGPVPKKTVRTLLTPSAFESEKLPADAARLRRGLRDPGRVRFAVFLGGPTQEYKMTVEDVKRFFALLGKRAAKEGDYVVTTSRRTPEPICRWLKQNLSADSGCQMLVIAAEDPRPEVVGGMMGLAEILIVSGDSISMISEAVATGKKVLVLNFSANGLPAKHLRFQEALVGRHGVVAARPGDFEAFYEELLRSSSSDLLEREKAQVIESLHRIL